MAKGTKNEATDTSFTENSGQIACLNNIINNEQDYNKIRLRIFLKKQPTLTKTSFYGTIEKKIYLCLNMALIILNPENITVSFCLLRRRTVLNVRIRLSAMFGGRCDFHGYFLR